MATDTAVDTLVRLGRCKGGVTIEDISRIIPIERMTLQEVGDLVLRVEEAGIPVAIDPVLLSQAEGVEGKLDFRTSTWDGWAIEVTDESGQVVSLVPFTKRSGLQ